MSSTRILAFALAIAILLISGIICHSLEQDSELLETAVARLPDVPMNFGDWNVQSNEAVDLDERSFAQAGAQGYWVRTYIHRRIHASVTVILMCGRAGKMSVHTPDICYQGAGYSLNEQPRVFVVRNELGDEGSQFWMAPFTRKKGLAKNLHLYWAWSRSGTWEAPSNPRWVYRGEPFLYKLYVVRDLSNDSKGAWNADLAESFLRQMLPEMHRALFPPSAQRE